MEMNTRGGVYYKKPVQNPIPRGGQAVSYQAHLEGPNRTKVQNICMAGDPGKDSYNGQLGKKRVGSMDKMIGNASCATFRTKIQIIS